MKDRIFYSWQSDSPANMNRSFILTAIEKAINELEKDKSTELQPVIDRDTLGVSGSPDISDSIFSKIDNAFMFVCDVSIINDGEKRLTPNPNVLIELGYAVKSIGWHRVVMIMNTHFGGPEKLPFDLRSRRVTTYNVSPSETEKSPGRTLLSKTLAIAMKSVFENHGSITNEKPEQAEMSWVKKDSSLFEEFKLVLPSKGSIQFIDKTNMAGFSWELKRIDDLYTFYYEWNDVEHEFLDVELESLRKKLYSLIGDYLHDIGINTFPTERAGRQTVPPEWETELPERFKEVVEKLHNTSTQIVNVHQELMRKGRQKLL